MKVRIYIIAFLLYAFNPAYAEDGYRLWLRYDRISDPVLLEKYNKNATGLIFEGGSPVLKAASKELKDGLHGLLGKEISELTKVKQDGIIIVGTPATSPIIASMKLDSRLAGLGDEGYILFSTSYRRKKVTVIAANSPAGVLYGTFHFIRIIQTHGDIASLEIKSSPKTRVRILNHWDNLNGTIERGYAGRSLWDWKSLPDSISSSYTDYARANASIGINSTVLTNVNANAQFLTPEYLKKVAALAGVFRQYNIKVYLTARFSSPIELGKLKTADPLDTEVIAWWKKKIDEIYSYIPDFGGLLIKANSEGQPGPQNYNRSHADGANMFADALAPHNGIVMWRAFVYDNNVPEDRAKQAYNEFVPLDGKFRKNVLIQVKNGPVDFQPREPFHPLFGAMPSTAIMPEFQITQEYLGFSIHLVYLGPLFEECLRSDTYARGPGSTVARVTDGTLFNHSLTAMAGVANTGNSRNWTGHPFGQANWYAFGRLAWDPDLHSDDIADEWIRMTFSNDSTFVNRIKRMMMSSRETAVNYMTPLGLHHIMYANVHYGPAPWVDRGRQDWTSVYYHRADREGIGFERTSAGSNAVSQYFPLVRDLYEKTETCPENLLLWFHHLPWTYKMRSGRTLWDELCSRYNSGVNAVRLMQGEWEKSKGIVDDERFEMVKSLLAEQEGNARIWRDACLQYFQTFSKMPVPEVYEKPEHPLDFYRNLRYGNDGRILRN